MKRLFISLFALVLILSSCNKTLSSDTESPKSDTPAVLTDNITSDMQKNLDNVYKYTEIDVPEYLYEIPADIPAGYEEYYTVNIRPYYFPTHRKTLILQGYDGDLHVYEYSSPTAKYTEKKIKTTTEIAAENVNYTQGIDNVYLVNGNLLRYMNVTFKEKDSMNRFISRPVLFVQSSEGEILTEKLLDFKEYDTTAKLYALSNGYIIILEGYKIYVLSQNLELIDTVDCEYAINQNQPMGKLIEASDGKIYITSLFNSTVYTFDIEKMNINLKHKSKTGYSVQVDYDGNVYYIDRNGIFLGDELILNWRNSSLNYDDIIITDIINRDTVLIQMNDVFENTSVPACLTHNSDIESEVKTIINLAVIGLGSNNELLDGALAYFNRTHDEYHVTVTEFYSQADMNKKTTAKDLFDKAIANGEKFDVVFLDNSMIDELSMYTNKNYFIDLSKYLNVGLIKSVKSAFSISDELYHVPVCFNLSTLASVGGTISDNLTPNSLYEMTDSIADDKTLSNAALVELFVSLYDYVDYTTLTCDFENTEFKKLMEYAKNSESRISNDIGYITSTSANVESIGKSVKSGNLSMLSLRLETLDVFAAAKLITDESLTLCGYPSVKYNGSLCKTDFTVGITAESKIKMGALKFLETLLSDTIQTSELILNSGIPVTEVGIDALLEYDEYYINFLSQSVSADKMMIKRYKAPLPTDPYPHPDADLPHVSLDNKDKAELRRLLCDSELPPVIDATLNDIISEEYSQYSSGDISVDEAAKRMQSRASIYLSERYN